MARPVTLLAALIRTGHQANAGLVLASVVVLTLRAFGQFTGLSGQPTGSEGLGVRDLEAVA